MNDDTPRTDKPNPAPDNPTRSADIKQSDSAPGGPAQPSVKEQFAEMDKRIDTEHRQFLRLLAQVNDELERVFVAMGHAAGVEQHWCSLAYTYAQMSMMAAKRSLYDGLADDKKRRRIRDHVAKINAAPLN